MRNDYIFNRATTQASEVAELVKSRVVMWIKAKFDIKIYTVEDFKGYLDGIRKVEISAIFNYLGFELWIPLNPLLSRPRLALMYRRYRGAYFGNRCLSSTFRLL
ncbi:hypothetical protein RHMOL_Rhmol03G0201200 [Rhododendron molle]|uniref:Uncharacterized protein n=1 Tax=Rhododendron molle TaxID=49168 RepID=A0ACC0PGW0_RHOML|nr:hypothetical protein RHMOL_Rhmol03G0201200 [Rhododendron molle]